MRLLNSRTFALQEFMGDDGVPSYAILSHTWGEDEVTCQDMANPGEAQQKMGYTKIKFCCDQASKDDFEWVWVDTCCIDKSSSAELSEAINSMFDWYKCAAVCYVYLSDVSEVPDLESVQGDFAKSRWFTRGWTLQELIAPSHALFFSKDWTLLGTKVTFRDLLSRITGIDSEILHGINSLNLEKFSVAKRMSWAAKRRTTRIEDTAYCLLGIFDVNMPLLYGEGNKAFLRLQEEILKVSNDHSIFAWGLPPVIPTMEACIQAEYDRQQERNTSVGRRSRSPSARRRTLRGLLADSPAAFEKSNNVTAIAGWVGSHGHPPVVHNRCVRINVPVISGIRTGLSFAILACDIDEPRYSFDHFLAVALLTWAGEVYLGRLELVLVSGHNNQLSDKDVIKEIMKTIQVKQRGWIDFSRL